MRNQKDITVRAGRAEDADDIAFIENTLFQDTGCKPFDQTHVMDWLNVHPEGLRVAELDGRVVAFIFMQLIHFDPRHPFPYSSHDQMTDYGRARSTHEPGGNAYCPVTFDSIYPHAGQQLIKQTMNYISSRNIPYSIGTSRLVGFGNYLAYLEKLGIIRQEFLSPDANYKLALWYVSHVVKKTNAVFEEIFPRVPDLKMPEPKRSDPVLGFYTANGLSVHSVLPNFITDIPSRNFAATVVYRAT